MPAFSEGDRVRVDIPDETDPEQRAFHGRQGTVVETIADDAGAVTGDPRDGVLYRVRFADGDEADFRWHDLRPP